MKYLLMLGVWGGMLSHALGQVETGTYYMLGITLGTAYNGSAYGYKNEGPPTYELEFYGDYFRHATGNFRWVRVTPKQYLELDLQSIGLLFTGMRAMWLTSEGRDLPPQAFAGTGRFRSLNRHLAEDLVHPDSSAAHFGTDYSFFALDYLRGGEQKLGFHLSLNGIGSYLNGSLPQLENSHNLRFPSRKLFWAFGPAISIDPGFVDQWRFTTRVNALFSMKKNGYHDQDSWGYGLEVFPSLRYVPGTIKGGFFFELFAKARKVLV